MKLRILKVGICLFILLPSKAYGFLSDTTTVEFLIEQSEILQQDLKTDSAFLLANNALLMAKELKYGKGIASSLQRIGSIYFGINQNDSAIFFWKKAMVIREELNDYQGAISSCLNLTYAYSNLSQLDKAFDILFHALRLNNSLKDSSTLSEIFIELGNLFILYKDFDKAKYYLLNAEKISRNINNVELQITVNSALGNFYFNKLDHKQALTYFLITERLLLSDNSNEQVQAVTFNNIALCYAQLKQYPKATFYYHKGLSEYLLNDMQYDVANTYFNLASMFNNQNMPDSAIFYLQKSLTISKEIKDLRHEALCNEFLADAYVLKGDFKTAYSFHLLSSLLKDSLLNSDKISSISEMQTKYDTEKKDQQIVLLDEQNKTKTIQRNGLIYGSLLLILFSLAVARQRNKIKKEKKRSDTLLLNILPAEVAEELKQTGASEAKLYNHVTVLFTDFVNFTGISSQLTPTELVQEIHKNFTVFDSIMEKHGIEKIKTIGDAYLAVCGLPHELVDHAQRIVDAALEIQDFMQRNNGKFQIRIGIHTGPVVAGIVGIKKFAYDIWGDTVNMANRMESNSEPGKINISDTTYELIKNEFRLHHRGKINAKNKGEVDMYFVEGRI